MSEAAFESFSARRIAESVRHAAGNRGTIAEHCRASGIVLASHDDATAAHVAEGLDLGFALSDFPATVEDARRARESGLCGLMGAPNVVAPGLRADLVRVRASGTSGVPPIVRGVRREGRRVA